MLSQSRSGRKPRTNALIFLINNLNTSTQDPVKWKKPKVDAAVKAGAFSFSMGLVIREHKCFCGCENNL